VKVGVVDPRTWGGGYGMGWRIRQRAARYSSQRAMFDDGWAPATEKLPPASRLPWYSAKAWTLPSSQ
jgi:hypothetical protein